MRSVAKREILSDQIRITRTDYKLGLRSSAFSLHIFEEDLLAAAVIELGGPAVGVAGDSLGGFKSPVIFQKIRDAGRPK